MEVLTLVAPKRLPVAPPIGPAPPPPAWAGARAALAEAKKIAGSGASSRAKDDALEAAYRFYADTAEAELLAFFIEVTIPRAPEEMEHILLGSPPWLKEGNHQQNAPAHRLGGG